MIPILAISIGDFNGIGPEVALKSLIHSDIKKRARVVLLGHNSIISYYQKVIGKKVSIEEIHSMDDVPEKAGVYQISLGTDIPKINPGSYSLQSGKLSMQAVSYGARACLTGTANALITAPISKEAIQKAGYYVPGHTEFLAEICGNPEVLMMLVNPDMNLRVVPFTIHIPLKDVASKINSENLLKQLALLKVCLQNDFQIDSPKIAVLGLNPHAGDGGVLGTEEIEKIIPALRAAQDNQINASGPYPADAFFANKMYEKCDAVVSMYHDQGLIPFKTLSFGAGVNFTGGLPIIRTSPDHGTAFGIAGNNQADHRSFSQALDMAYDLSLKRANGN